MYKIKLLIATTGFIILAFFNPAIAGAEIKSDCVKIISQNLCVTATFASPPKANVNSPFQLTFSRLNADGSPQPGSASPTEGFQVDLFMPEMGHGSSPVRIRSLPDPGEYEVMDVYFVMSGAWQLRLKFDRLIVTIPVSVQ